MKWKTGNVGYINCRARISQSDSGELDDALASITAPVSTLGGAGGDRSKSTWIINLRGGNWWSVTP